METQEAIELFIKFVEQRGQFIENLKIRNGFFNKPRQLLAILNHCPRLEAVRFEHCYFSNNKPGVKSLPPFTNLHSLTCDHCHFGVYDYFVKAPIKLLKVPVTSGHRSNSTIDIFKTWNNLECFDIYSDAFQKHFESPSSRVMPYKLKKFSCLISNNFTGRS